MSDDDELLMPTAEEELSVHRITGDVATIQVNNETRHFDQHNDDNDNDNDEEANSVRAARLARLAKQLDAEDDVHVDIEDDLGIDLDDDDDDDNDNTTTTINQGLKRLPSKRSLHQQSTGTIGTDISFADVEVNDEDVDDEVDRMLDDTTTSSTDQNKISDEHKNGDTHAQQHPPKRRKSIAEVMSEALQQSDKKFYSEQQNQQQQHSDPNNNNNNNFEASPASTTASQFFSPQSIGGSSASPASSQQQGSSSPSRNLMLGNNNNINNNRDNQNMMMMMSTPPPSSSTMMMQNNNNNINSTYKPPTTWSEKKARMTRSNHTPSATTNGGVTPSPNKNNNSSGTEIFSPFSLFLSSRERSRIGATAGKSSSSLFNSNGENNNSNNDQHQVDFILLSAAEEYRRMSIESRQNEERSELLTFCFSALSRLSQYLVRKSQKSSSKFEHAVSKWFRKWATGCDLVLEAKLREANDFLEEYLSQIASEQQQQQQQQQNQNQNNNNTIATRDIRSPSLSSTMANTTTGGMPHFSLGSTMTQQTVLSPQSLDLAMRNQMSQMQQHQQYQQQHQQFQMMSSLLLSNERIAFTSVQNLQKALINFSKNFEPLNAQPTSGQLRSEGILSDMQNWGPGDFQDISFLTAPTVLIIGPKSSGKSCVAHCLVNKKPFFSTVPKTQPTPGIVCSVAHLKECQTTAHAKMTLTTEMMDIENSSSNSNHHHSSAASIASSSSTSSSSANHKIGNNQFAFAGRMPFNETLLSSRAARAQPSIKTQDENITLKSSSHLRLIEVPHHLLSAIPPKILPLSGFEVLLTFDVTLDGTKARRELAAQFRQIAATVITALQERGETSSFQPQVTIPVYLVATHVDKMKATEKSPNALAGLLRDLRLWFKFMQESIVFSPRTSSGSSNSNNNNNADSATQNNNNSNSKENNNNDTNTAKLVSQYIQFYLVDVYAVSCQDWSVVGERPRSGTSFHEMASDMFRTMSMLRPLTPIHVGAQIVDQFLDALSSYEETTGQTIENLEGIKTAFSIRPDTNSHIACEIAVRQLVTSTSNSSNNNNSKYIDMISVPVPVKRILIGVTTFFTAIGRWANSSGFFIDYALFLRLVLHHVQVKQLLNDVAIVPQKDPRYDTMSKVFSRCLQYAFVDVLSYHGLVTVDEEEGFSSVLVGPQVLTRIVNCFSALHAATRSTSQLNITEKQADFFNENCIRKGNSNGNALTDFPEIGKTEKEVASNPSEQHALRVLHEEIMRDLTSWQFGAITPFSWRALFRGPLAPLSQTDDDFFMWCCKQISPPLGFLDQNWTPEHIDLVSSPTGSHLPSARRQAAIERRNSQSAGTATQQNQNQNQQKVIPGPILLSTIFAKPIDSRSYQFLIASLTVADDEQQPYCAHATFSGCPPPASITQSLLMNILHRAASGEGNFTIKDVGVWSNCICFSAYQQFSSSSLSSSYRQNNNMRESPMQPEGGGGGSNLSTSDDMMTNNNNQQQWEYCSIVCIYWDIENNASNPSCRIVVAGISAGGGSGSPPKNRTNTESYNNNNNQDDGHSPLDDPPHSLSDTNSFQNGYDNNNNNQQQQIIIDVSHATKTIEWLKHELDQTILVMNSSLTELRPSTLYRESRLGSVAPVAFSGVAQTAREILAGCSRRACENLVRDLQLLHEKSWESESVPMKAILQTLMLEERVGPQYQHHQ